MARRKHRRCATLSEGLQGLAQKESLVRLLEIGNGVKLLRRGRDRRLRHDVRSHPQPELAGPGSACRTSALDRERCVHASRDAAGEDHRGRRRIIHQDDALRQRALNQDRSVGGDPGRAAEEIVEAVMKKKGI